MRPIASDGDVSKGLHVLLGPQSIARVQMKVQMKRKFDIDRMWREVLPEVFDIPPAVDLMAASYQ